MPCTDLTLTSFPLTIFREGLFFADCGVKPPLATAAARLRKLTLDLRRDKGFSNALRSLLQFATGLTNLKISFHPPLENWNYPGAIIGVPETGIPPLKSCELHNVAIDEWDFRALIRACSDKLVYLYLTGVQLQPRLKTATVEYEASGSETDEPEHESETDESEHEAADTWPTGGWREMFRFMGHRRLKNATVHFDRLYDTGNWYFAYDTTHSTESDTNLHRLNRWIETGEDFSFDVSNHDDTVSWGRHIRAVAPNALVRTSFGWRYTFKEPDDPNVRYI